MDYILAFTLRTRRFFCISRCYAHTARFALRAPAHTHCGQGRFSWHAFALPRDLPRTVHFPRLLHCHPPLVCMPLLCPHYTTTTCPTDNSIVCRRVCLTFHPTTSCPLPFPCIAHMKAYCSRRWAWDGQETERTWAGKRQTGQEKRQNRQDKTRQAWTGTDRFQAGLCPSLPLPPNMPPSMVASLGLWDALSPPHLPHLICPQKHSGVGHGLAHTGAQNPILNPSVSCVSPLLCGCVCVFYFKCLTGTLWGQGGWHRAMPAALLSQQPLFLASSSPF